MRGFQGCVGIERVHGFARKALGQSFLCRAWVQALTRLRLIARVLVRGLQWLAGVLSAFSVSGPAPADRATWVSTGPRELGFFNPPSLNIAHLRG